MGNNPETCGNKACAEAVEGPKRVPREVVKDGMGQREMSWGDVALYGYGGIVDETQKNDIHDAGMRDEKWKGMMDQEGVNECV